MELFTLERDRERELLKQQATNGICFFQRIFKSASNEFQTFSNAGKVWRASLNSSTVSGTSCRYMNALANKLQSFRKKICAKRKKFLNETGKSCNCNSESFIELLGGKDFTRLDKELFSSSNCLFSLLTSLLQLLN